MTVLHAALELADQGIPVFPVRDDKRPATERGFKDASLDPSEIRKLWRLSSAPLIGIPTGQASGFTVVDVDPRHGGDAWLAQHGATLPRTRRHVTRSGGVHLLFDYEPGIRNSASRVAPGVDVRGDGGFIVWWPAAGCGVVDAPAARMPEWLAAACRRKPAPATDITRAVSRPSNASAVIALADACRAIRDAAPGSRYDACRVATWSLAQLVLGGFLDEQTARDAVHDAAEDAGGENLALVDALWTGALAKVEPAAVPGSEFAAAPLHLGMRARFLHPADCATAAPRGYVVKHLIAPGDVGAIIGAPGGGKSMLAPHIAYAVAQGRPVFGLRTKQGRALYVAAEDSAGMRQRIHALRLQHGDAPDLALVDCGNLRDAETAVDLQAAVADWRPALLVIDTLGAAFAGIDENSSGDMGVVVALARKLASTGAAILLIHHIAKHGDGSPRGHGVLNGTLDMSLSLAPKDEAGIIRGTLLKNRSGTTDRDMAFRFRSVELGDDEDGDPVTAPMAVEIVGAAAVRPKLSNSARAALQMLRQMGGKAPEAAWRERCDTERVVSAADNPDSRKRSFRRAYAELVQSGEVSAKDDNVSISRVFVADDADKPDQWRTASDMSAGHSHAGADMRTATL